ncbi:MAG: hypothetical protein KDC57_02110 [Saprospiraceae bacterium]|nr:hypothetical protein [Saprospiraceae bacterium]
MEALLKSYQDQLKAIAKDIQASELLATYLESEEEEDYQALRDAFEPALAELHETVASHHPLQIISLEKEMLDPEFEGLFMPRILGYSVLRGEVSDVYKYIRPQDHFREVLLAICNSSNFEILKQRIGQAIQVGFALSSRIWISHLMNEIANKRVIQFLNAQVMPKYQEKDERRIGRAKFKRQFTNAHYLTAEFPENVEELKILYPSLRTFLLERIRRYEDNNSFLYQIIKMLQNPKIKGTPEYTQVLAIVANFYDLNDQDKKVLEQDLNRARKENPTFNEDYFQFIINLIEHGVFIDGRCQQRVLELLDKKVKDDMLGFYRLMDDLYSKGYVHEETIQGIRAYYDSHEGLSTVNEAVRQTLLMNFRKLMENLPTQDYPEYFEYNKVFTMYMNMFANQEFNQEIKNFSLAYIKRLLKVYTDKRGKDYQDIKKFVSSTFTELGFMKDKEVIELFKTKRKKKPE